MNRPKHQRNKYNDLERLSKIVSQRRLDQQFIEKGGRIIYVVDSDVVKLYSAPEEQAIDTRIRQGYCQFFKKSNSDQAKKLAIALSHYLFNKLSKDIPLLVFDAQLTEINDICNGVIRAFTKTQSNNRQKGKPIVNGLSDILEIAKEIDSATEDSLTDKGEKKLIKMMEDISKQLLKSSLALGKEISRLNHILDTDTPKLVGIPFLLEHYPKIAKKQFFRVKSDVFERSIIRSAIEERLIKVNRKTKSHLRNNDISALSNLFFINKNLIDNGEKIRFVLISGDEKIVQASDVLSVAIRECFGINSSESSCGFSELYIRHPLSFINDNDFIGDLDYELIEGIENELRSLHGSGAIDKVREFDDVASLMQSALPLNMGEFLSHEFEERAENIPEIFDTFLDKRLATYSIGITDYTDKKVENLLEKLRGTKSGEEALREIYNEANNIFVKETNTLALNLQQEALAGFESEDKHCYRIPPFLRFDKVKTAETYIKSWVLQHNEHDTKKLYEEVEGEDPSGYSITLCNATIWAHLDDWKLVQENAGRAFKIAIDLIDDGISNNHNLFLGHEAAYLSVVATRHLATDNTKEDVKRLLTNLRNVIDYTKYLWNEFRDRNQLQTIKPADEEYRFIHELLSINLMEIWYEVFYFGLEEKNEDDIKEILNSLNKIKGELFEMVRKTEEQIKIPKNKEKIDYLRYAQRHAINNYCLVFMVLDKHTVLRSECHYENIVYVLNVYKTTNIAINKPFKVKSYLHVCTLAVANLLYAEMKKQESNEVNSMLHSLLTEDNINKYSRKPYERKRYEFFRDIVGYT